MSDAIGRTVDEKLDRKAWMRRVARRMVDVLIATSDQPIDEPEAKTDTEQESS